MLISLLTLLACSNAAQAALVTLPYVYINGQTLPANQLNSDFQIIYNDYNGNINDANIAAGANIQLSKLLLTAPAITLEATGNNAWGAGITGDTQPRVSLRSDGYLFFGPGGSTVPDSMIKRSGIAAFAFRNAADSADATITCGPITASGTSTINTLTLTNTLTVPNGGTGATALTGHGAVVMNAGGTAQTTVAPGTSGNQLTSNGTDWISQAPSTSLVNFGGNGSDGAITLNATPGTTPNNKTWYATTFATSGTFSYPCATCVINATSTITFSAGISYQDLFGGRFAFGQGIASNNGVPGGGPAPGQGGGAGLVAATPNGGGGGASCVADGGTGGRANANAPDTGGRISSSLTGTGPGSAVKIGSGGGSGGTGAAGSSGNAGQGGGVLRMYAVGAINTSAGSISVAGSTGVNGTTLAGGSGGGGGGSVWMFSQTSIVTASSIQASGAAGSNGAGAGGEGGGGGGGGLVVAMSPTTPTGTPAIGGGAAGTGTVAGTAGNTGVFVPYTQTPTLPTIVYFEDAHGVLAQIHLARAKKWLAGKPIDRVDFNQHENVTWVAAWYAKPGQFDHLCYMLNYGGELSETADASVVDITDAVKNIRADKAVLQAFPPVKMEAQTCDDTELLRPAA